MHAGTSSTAPHVYEHRLRFGDLDWQGHVNNVKYVEYLQEAHFTLLDPNEWSLYRPAGDTFVVASHSVSYLRPLLWRNSVQVETWVCRVGRAKVELRSTIGDGRHEYVAARSIYVAYDLPDHRSRPLSGIERAHLGRFTGRGEGEAAPAAQKAATPRAHAVVGVGTAD